jgi:seryl-tRNA synthetase
MKYQYGPVLTYTKGKITMLDIKFIRDNPTAFDALLKRRSLEPMAEKINAMDEKKRQLITLIQQLQQAKHEKAKSIHQIANKTSLEYKMALKDASDIKDKLVELEQKLSQENELDITLDNIPNMPLADVPDGRDEEDNVEISRWGDLPNFSFTPKAHFSLGEELGMMDFVQTAKISGSRFVTLSSSLAKLERALKNFMLDIHVNEFNYLELNVPHLVKEKAMYNVGQLPKFAADSFKTTEDFRLIPTAEVALTNMVSEMILKEEQLPLRYTAYSLCFRSEAGSAGKDTRGMIRNHQFSKVELVSITTPQDAEKEHQRMLGAAEEILRRLKLPYRVMLLCAGDMGFSATKTYDLEVWMPAQNKYREISSCSNCGDFQARRMKARYKVAQQNILVHTLNGSALAIGRTIAAIMENYQNADGSIRIPACLQSYMGSDLIKLS